MSVRDELVTALREAGMADVPERFSIAPVHQEIPHRVLAGIDAFIRVFDRVTTREAWQRCAAAGRARPETCFFSAWDFHVPPDRPDTWKLIELNDNGSGFLFASLLDRRYWELAGLARRADIEAPPDASAFAAQLVRMIEAEARAFGGDPLRGLVLVLDDPESIERGRFRDELALLRDVCRNAGWRAEIAAPSETSWNDGRLLFRGEPVGFVVNRSTDFLFERDDLAAVRAAYESRRVYIAPNPFTYATRSDKRLLEWLSSPARDRELGIEPDERAILSAHVPETHVLSDDNADALALSRDEWFFKPAHGFASHGLLPGAQVGRPRLHRLLRHGAPYVAQRRAPKQRLETEDGTSLWTDLRVWAWRGERFLISGRASREPDRLDLSPPGGWVPTYARTA